VTAADASDRRQDEVERYMQDFKEGVLWAYAAWNLVDRRYVPMPSAARNGVFAGHVAFAAALEKQWPVEERRKAGR